MKKLLFPTLLTTIIILATSCEGDYGPSKSDFDPKDSITKTTAIEMINHYLAPEVDHTLPAIIKQIYMEAKDIKKILKNKNISRIKYLTAAYSASYPEPAKQNKITVIIQIKEEKGGTTKYYYYDIATVSKVVNAKVICPPPNDCSTTIED
jgi:hypothetical protein